MDEATVCEVQQWLHKADHDLRAAARLTETGEDEPLLDTAVYYCQQAVEKALEAYLTAHGIVFSKIHLLAPLLEQCKDKEKEFSRFDDAADFLTPFATEFRYPGETMDPDPADVTEAYAVAAEIVSFVVARLSEIDKGQPEGNDMEFRAGKE
jgi:HEPN domain-containing protein